ncbi:MAG: hypothetical protein ACLR0N_02815 [Bilophila wadsworthia]
MRNFSHHGQDVWDYLPDEELAYQYSPEVVHDPAPSFRSSPARAASTRISPSRPS